MRGDHGNGAVLPNQRNGLNSGQTHDDVAADLLGRALDLQRLPRTIDHDAQILADSLAHKIAMERRMRCRGADVR